MVGEDTTQPRMIDDLDRNLTEPALLVEKGLKKPLVIRLAEVVSIIGRGDTAGVRLDNDGLSREHVKIVNLGDGVVNLVDLGSTNGTYLNGTRIDLALLNEGDHIQLGPDVVLRFTYNPDSVSQVTRPGKRESRNTLHEIPLTERQLEIALLVTEGCTNATIADHLGISVRTVTSHLDHIYERLSISSRAALVRIIAEADLLRHDRAHR